MYLKQIFTAERKSKDASPLPWSTWAFLQGVYTRKLQVLALTELKQGENCTVEWKSEKNILKFKQEYHFGWENVIFHH